MLLAAAMHIELMGWVPAVVFPGATLIQLVATIRARSATGMSAITWVLFGLANLGLYGWTGKHFALQSLIGLLGTAALDFLIVLVILRTRRKARTVV